jgi:peptide deformylase
LKLEILQAGEAVLRQIARPVAADEIHSPQFRQAIADMLETLRLAPGVGLAAPQIGLGLQLAIVEDLAQYQSAWSPEQLRARRRVPVAFHVLINPRFEVVEEQATAEFFEGCLSVAGYTAQVRRYQRVRVRYLDRHGAPQLVEADGWYARILQHEIDHLNGTLYVDRMKPRTFMTIEHYNGRWRNAEDEARRLFGP